MDFTATTQLETRGYLPESAETQRRRSLDAEGAATPLTRAHARRRFKRQRALAHGLAGLTFGVLILHPVTMAIFAWLDPGQGSADLELVLGRLVHSFSSEMLPMTVVFAVFSMAIGVMDGYYRSMLRFQRDDFKNQLTINERYRRRLEAQNIALRELGRTKRQMTYFLVHDLKNHLGCVLGYAKLLAARGDGDFWSVGDCDAVTKITRQAKRMAGAVRDVLDLAKLEHQPTLKAAEVPVARILNNARKSAVLRPGEGRLDLDIAFPISLHAYCNQGMIERVLANLVSNAVRHNGEDVTVTLGAESGKDGVVFSCEDTGHGIPDAVKDKLFDEFTSSSRDEGPTPSYGLGLAFCRAAVEAHGGKICFKSEPGKGTAFSFTIPNQQPAVCSGRKRVESND